MKPIEKEFVSKSVRRGTIIVLRPADALRMVLRCRELGIRILGVDGFFVTAAGIQPSMDESIDFCGSTAEYSWTTAEAFITERSNSNLSFEVVADSTAKIFVRLLNHTVERWRSVHAEHLHDSIYRIAVQFYDRVAESWQFEPGDIVSCENLQSVGGPAVAATRKATG